MPVSMPGNISEYCLASYMCTVDLTLLHGICKAGKASLKVHAPKDFCRGGVELDQEISKVASSRQKFPKVIMISSAF